VQEIFFLNEGSKNVFKPKKNVPLLHEKKTKENKL